MATRLHDTPEGIMGATLDVLNSIASVADSFDEDAEAWRTQRDYRHENLCTGIARGLRLARSAVLGAIGADE